VRVQVTLGYGGTYASGFPDELALEEWLTRLEDLQAAEQHLNDGEHVSGPAAGIYRDRVDGASARFAGRVIRSGREARAILANPALQIYHGKGMTCVFDPSRALCQLGSSASGAGDRRTPDLDDCQPSCRNIARTDRDISTVAEEARFLQALADDELSPPIRHARERRRLAHIEKILADHGIRPRSSAAGQEHPV
jgi:hypothetical protein